MQNIKIEKAESITPYESLQVDEIIKWHREEPSVVTKAFNTLFKPAVWIVNKVIPKGAIEGALVGSDWIAEKLTDKQDILRDGGVASIDELQKKSLELSDKLADNVHNWAIGMATVEGGATGFFGATALAVDIPMIIILALRTIHKIGLCYGFEYETAEDRQIYFQILSSAGANNMEQKVTAIATLQMIHQTIAKQTWKAIGEKAAQAQISKEASIIAIKNLAKQLGINITKRKALQAIPVTGAFVGASLNSLFIRDVGFAARRVFQQRWLENNGRIRVEIV